MNDSAILTAALAYAARGWGVFPCRAACSEERGKDGKPRFEAKQPLVKGGLNAASTDAAQIRKWWGRWPDALIGLPLGGATGLFALDFDPRTVVDPESGQVTEFTLADLKADTEAMIGGQLPPSVAQMTPSKGVHLFFYQPGCSAANSGRGVDGDPIRNRGALPAHVDVRGEGGYVIVAPSVVIASEKSATGPYRWLRGDLLASLDDVAAPGIRGEMEVAEAPALLVALLRAPKGARVVDGAIVLPSAPTEARERPLAGVAGAIADGRRRYGLAMLSKLTDELARAAEGSRGQTLNRVAYALGGAVAAGVLRAAVVVAAIEDAAESCGLVGKDGHEAVMANIRRAMKDGEARPLDLAAVDRDSEEWQRRRGARQFVGGSSGSGQADRPRPQAGSAGSSGPAGFSPRPEFAANQDAPRAPAPPDGGGFSEPSHGGRARRRDARWGPGDAWGWAWAWELAALLRSLNRRARMPLTDLGNAERWANLYGRKFRYSEELGWMAWDGRRWKREGGDPRSYPPSLGLSAIDTIRQIQAEAKFIEADGCPDEDAAAVGEVPYRPGGMNVCLKWVGPKDDKRPLLRSMVHRDHGRSSEASGKISAIATLARLQPGVAVASSVFDRHLMMFNVANGTLDFVKPERDGEAARVVLRPHNPNDMLTKVSPAVYDPEATAPLYDAFFGRVQPEAPMRRFLHAYAGYTLTGETGEQCFVILHGTEGGNGKSTWELTRAHVMGDYAQKVGIETFLEGNFERAGSQASPDIARLPGARMVYTAEPKKGRKFAEDLIKLVTGSESVTARHLNRDFFEFIPEFKISVACNRPPEASDDPAFWRRVRLTPWTVSVPAGERDKTLPAKLQAEASGILNHLVAGALDWMQGGLPVPDAVTQATAKYQDQSDPLGRFVKAAVVVDPRSRVQSSQLYELFRAWAMYAEEKEWTQTYFSRQMTAKGFDKIQSGPIWWLGIRPRYRAEAFVVVRRDPYGEETGRHRRDEIDEGALADPEEYLAPSTRAPAVAVPQRFEPSSGDDASPAATWPDHGEGGDGDVGW